MASLLCVGLFGSLCVCVCVQMHVSVVKLCWSCRVEQACSSCRLHAPPLQPATVCSNLKSRAINRRSGPVFKLFKLLVNAGSRKLRLDPSGQESRSQMLAERRQAELRSFRCCVSSRSNVAETGIIVNVCRCSSIRKKEERIFFSRRS